MGYTEIVSLQSYQNMNIKYCNIKYCTESDLFIHLKNHWPFSAISYHQAIQESAESFSPKAFDNEYGSSNNFQDLEAVKLMCILGWKLWSLT